MVNSTQAATSHPYSTRGIIRLIVLLGVFFIFRFHGGGEGLFFHATCLAFNFLRCIPNRGKYLLRAGVGGGANVSFYVFLNEL